METSQEAFDEVELNVGERLQTEYIDEEEAENRLSVIRHECMSWVHLQLFTMMSFFIMAICLFTDSSLLFILLPFSGYDIFMAYSYTSHLRSQTQKYDQNNIIKNLFERLCSLFSIFMLILAVKIDGYYCFGAAGAGVLAQIARFLLRRREFYECQNFSGMFFFQFRWMKILMILSAGLKVKEIIDWKWITVLWPIWVSLSLSSILSLGVFLLALGAVFSWFAKESTGSELVSTIWLLFAILGGTFSFGVLGFSIAWNLEGEMSERDLGSIALLPAVYLGSLVIFTYLHLDKLVVWWDTFFINDQDREQVVPENHEFVMVQTETPEPRHTRSLSSQFLTILKSPPRALVRLSSTYYKPAEKEEASKQRHYRALSTSTHPLTSKESHRRAVSSATTQDRVQLLEETTPRFDPDNEVPSKICFMCDYDKSDAVLMECGHGGICHACALQLWKTSSQCHLCRSPISHVLKIELPSSNYVKILTTTKLVSSNSEAQPLPEILEVPEFM